MDNGCNQNQYNLSRESDFFKGTRYMVDALHYRSHKSCAQAYNSKNYLWVKNSSMSEQKNSLLDNIRTQVLFMDQFNTMFFVRYFLYRHNLRQDDKASGQVSFR